MEIKQQKHFNRRDLRPAAKRCGPGARPGAGTPPERAEAVAEAGLAGVELGHPRGACEDPRAHAMLCGRARPSSAAREAILFFCSCEDAAIFWF